MGGPSAFGIYMFSLCTGISLYLLLFDCSNGCSLTALKSIEVTQHSGSFEWGVHLPFGIYIFSLCAGISLYLPIIWPVSNGCSLTALKSIEVTQCSGSFEWGGRQIYPKSAKFELTCRLDALLHRRSFRITYERPNECTSALYMSLTR